MSTTNIDALLDKYKKGETSPEETATVENWLKNTDSCETDWAKMDGGSPTVDVFYNKIAKKICSYFVT